MIMEIKAFILQHVPSEQQFNGINACRRVAWERNSISYYPYRAFGEYESWQENGDLGKAIQNGELYASLVESQGNIVAHAALVRNKFGVELGRVFSQIGGHGYGIHAINKAREHAEELGIPEIHMGVSYNRTAMWRAYEETFGQHDWKLAVLGILPDIYQEYDMQWGEILSHAVKDGDMLLPPVYDAQPKILQQFAKGIQEINNHCMQFAERQPSDEVLLPYKFSEHVSALSWHDVENQKKYLDEGYQPVGLVKIQNVWHFVIFKGELPERREGKGLDLQHGRNPIVYPREVAGVQVHRIMDSIYGGTI